MSAETNAKSFCRKNNSYFGKASMAAILKSFWFYCEGLHKVSDMILEESLKQEEENKRKIKELDDENQ